MEAIYDATYQLTPSLLLVLFLFLLDYYLKRKEIRKWNNGICPKCGGKWKFSDYEGNDDVYTCKNNHFVFIPHK